MPPFPKPRFDFTTVEGLRADRAKAESFLYSEWVPPLTDLIRRVDATGERERGNPDFQKEIWTSTAVSDGGSVKDETITSFLDAEFCAWFAEETVRPLPENPKERTAALASLLERVLTRIEDSWHYNWKPWVESLRTLAAFFPNDFTAIANPDDLLKFTRQGLGIEIVGKKPVEANRLVLDRFQRAFGAPESDPEGRAERMLLIYAYSQAWHHYDDREPRVWIVRAGASGEDEAYVLSNALAMLGFHDLPAPEVDTRAEYKARVQEDTEWSAQKIDATAGQVWSFAHDILEGDIIVLPRKRDDKRVHWGRVEGDYEHREVEGQRRHTRPVRWASRSIARSRLRQFKSVLDFRRTVKDFDESEVPGLLSVLGESPRPTEDSMESPTKPSFADLWTVLSKDAKTEKLRFDRSLVEALHLGLWADPQRHFAVLSGLSGTGKTQIALRYAMALTGAESDTGGPVEVISVHPGWHDPGPLLGYVNPLTGGYTRTEFLNFLLDAEKNPRQPHVLILDEMNLSHPEQYFAPILSAMEIRDGEIPLHREDPKKLGVPTGVDYPSNLVIIGTVNMDETTMGISDKVLDRAFTLEFWDIDPEKWPGWDGCALEPAEKSKVRGILTELTKALAPARRHFGWRVIKEVVGFLEGRTQDSGIELTAEDALDQVIYAKVLPKLRGSDTGRFRKCLDATLSVLEKHHLERCAEKVQALKEDLETTGSCSFWR